MSIVIQLPRDINRFCRTCMNVTEDHKDSFENYVIRNNQPTNLSKILQSVTSLKVTADDGLPETLCSLCTEHLTAAYSFINLCKDVDANLRNLLMLSEQSEEKTGTVNQLNNLSFTGQTTSKEVEDDNHVCQICHDSFISYYSLSMHMIKHNTNKTLYERLLENQGEDSKTMLNCKMGIDLEMDIINFIRERKSALKTQINKFVSDETQEITNSVIDPNNSKKITEKPLKVINNDQFQQASEKKKTKIGIQCKMCSKKFDCRKELISHICKPVVNEDSKFITTCSLCDKIFGDISTLSLHFLKHAVATANASIEDEYFFCEVCGETFESESFLSKHYNEKHQGKPTWPCSHCSTVFEQESDLIRHNEIHSVEIPEHCIKKESYVCVLCNGVYLSKKELLKHSIEHLMKKYSCKKCCSSFCTQHVYFAHLTSHAAYQYTCPTCGKFLSTKSALKSHIVGVHSVELRHTCSTCAKSFATPNRLRTHLQIHKSTKKYVCSYCGYSTHKAGDLRMHTRTHTSERPYKCTFAKCTASFKTSSHLCDHVRRHMQIRKFKCTICSVGFTTNHGLKIHQMQHTGERPHSCVICHQKFRRKYHVKVHMKQHESKA